MKPIGARELRYLFLAKLLKSHDAKFFSCNPESEAQSPFDCFRTGMLFLFKKAHNEILHRNLTLCTTFYSQWSTSFSKKSLNKIAYLWFCPLALVMYQGGDQQFSAALGLRSNFNIGWGSLARHRNKVSIASK